MLVFVRFGLWAALLLFAVILLGLSAGFINRTEDGTNHYYGSAALLLVVSIFILLLAPVYAFASFMSKAFGFVTAAFVELAVVFFLWVLDLGGAASLSDDISNANCGRSVYVGAFDRWNGWRTACQVGKATIAFGWMIWIMLTVLMGLLILAIVKTKDYKMQTHEMLGGGSVRKPGSVGP